MTRVWDVSIGVMYAAKAPLKLEYRERLKREVYLLQQIEHASWFNFYHKAVSINTVLAKCRQPRVLDGVQGATLDPRVRPIRVSP